jgi:hypothetical protein
VNPIILLQNGGKIIIISFRQPLNDLYFTNVTVFLEAKVRKRMLRGDVRPKGIYKPKDGRNMKE